MKKILSLSVLGLMIAVTASAHVTVKPASVGLAARQVFTVSVPTEGNSPTVGLRLMVPEGIAYVTPTVKPGWNVQVKTKSTGKMAVDEDGMEVEETIPTEIVWTAGIIPIGQRDEFTFSTQVPSTAATLAWKAYQTYANGTVVSWDQTPGSNVDHPYSSTAVVDDLTNTPPATEEAPKKNMAKENGALTLSIVALALAVVALVRK